MKMSIKNMVRLGILLRRFKNPGEYRAPVRRVRCLCRKIRKQVGERLRETVVAGIVRRTFFQAEEAVADLPVILKRDYRIEIMPVQTGQPG